MVFILFCFVWCSFYLLSDKSEVSKFFKHFYAPTHIQFGKSIKVVRSNNGMELLCLKLFFLKHDVFHQTSIVSTPQQNDGVERKYRHILNVVCAFLFQASLPI